MSVHRLDLHYVPEGVCEVAWLAALGHSRHHCHNQATCKVIADGNEYLSCDVCWAELEGLAA